MTVQLPRRWRRRRHVTGSVNACPCKPASGADKGLPFGTLVAGSSSGARSRTGLAERRTRDTDRAETESPPSVAESGGLEPHTLVPNRLATGGAPTRASLSVEEGGGVEPQCFTTADFQDRCATAGTSPSKNPVNTGITGITGFRLFRSGQVTHEPEPFFRRARAIDHRRLHG